DRLRLAGEDPGQPHDPHPEREHLIEFLYGSIGDDTVVACTYGADCHAEATIRALVQAALDEVRAALGAPPPPDRWALPPAVAHLHHLLAAA
ncbi:MAG TPA: hypothetical protein VFM54_02800, partial [Micromonosporaceae bacterium]|nr:hypothetical protein [Micromonosporaceae bacterium]